MPSPRPGVSLRAVQTALLLAIVTLAVAGLVYMNTGCSGATAPVRLPPQVVCGGSLATMLPPDPDRVTLGDLKAFVREYRRCLEAPDGGT